MSFALFSPVDCTPPARAPVQYAVFDLDSTLVFSKSGKLFAPYWGDVVVHPAACAVINSIKAKGLGVVIMSNQSIDSEQTRAKLQHAANYFQAHVLAAMGKNSPYRKPAALLWDAWVLNRQQADGVTPVPAFYCGDAAGPELAGGFPAYCWSDADSKFAAAIGAPFVLPHTMLPAPPIQVGAAGAPTVLVLVGNPGSGKSEFGRYFIKNAPGAWAHVEQDTHSNRKAVLNSTRRYLALGSSVVVDATHPSRARRAELYDIAAEFGAQARVVWLPRGGREANKLRPKPVPTVAYSMYTKYFEDPRDDGVKVDIVV